MADTLLATTETPPIPLTLVRTTEFDSWSGGLSATRRSWVTRAQFTAKGGEFAWLPGEDGDPTDLVVGWDGKDDLATLGGLPFRIPEGVYQLTTAVSDLQLLGWSLGAYRFARYTETDRDPAQLLAGEANDLDTVANIEAATTLVRDLINIPAGDMLPSNLADEAMQVADANSAECRITVGDDLLAENYGAIHAVGRASDDAPRLIDIFWGNKTDPLVVLVGKGVCFDSGGLDIKTAAGMRTMKKDMGGAAHALGLAQLIMTQKLPIRLRVLIGAVENAIAGNAYRPGDILQTYKGISVEIDNTDAEGRLVLCDCLALAAEQEPQLIIDFATLTGSARSAVGSEIAAMFCNDEAVAAEIFESGIRWDDPVWRLPLHEPYGYLLNSKVADTVNSAATPYAGAITAALFLQKFVDDVPWVHFDIMAFNTRERPGRPEGAEAMAVRAVFGYLSERFGG
ncbi:MAG: leucyl aminopeptidase family protein [Gammaproteobacteria bacterium]|nr:leucyl aminopeptidase family protein [Gammaproteobacteria bacterium]